jgi:diaminopimelate decarboxylase
MTMSPGNWLRHQDGILHCEGQSLERLASEVGTPVYVYSGHALDHAYRSIDDALGFAPHLIAYAVKAAGTLGLLHRLAGLGCGADIVSGGELRRALHAGIPPQRILFSGVGKLDEEIEAALAAGIRSLHVESATELEVTEHLAERRGVRAPIALRVNPDVDPETHPYISTGMHRSKFGIDLQTARDLLPRIVRSPHLVLEGVSCHIGSQLASPAPLEEAVTAVARFALECRAAGAPVRSLDAGGGWPISYGDEPSPYPAYAEYGAAIERGLHAAGAADLEVVVEPGRALVGEPGLLLTRVLLTKDQPEKRFVIVDAAMTELIRPALYGAHHALVPVREPGPQPWSPVDVVGPVCESGDFLATDRPMPPMQRGELLAVRGAGAYGASMSSNYNARPRPAEVLVDGDRYDVIRQRESLEQLWAGERQS